MNLNKGRSTLSWYGLVVAVSVVVSLLGGRFQLPTGEAAGEPQNLIRLESRMNQIEQRLYSIEVNIRNLEQQVRLLTDAPAAGARGTRDSEMLLMRREIETSRQRLEEIACALLRVDERTLAPAAREARRKSATDDADPCRLNSDAPLRLSIRP
jgi:hypothetical protein